MFVIRNAQMQAFRDNILREVQAESLAVWPAAECPAEVEIAQLIERARGYGLGSRSQLTRLLALARSMGVAFDLAPQHLGLREVLADIELSGELKLNVLEESLQGRGKLP